MADAHRVTGRGEGAGLPARQAGDGILLAVRLTPKAERDEVGGIETAVDGPALKVRVRAAPEKGKANAALLAALADWFGIPKTQCRLVAGGKSRLKRVHIRGEPDALMDRLASRIAQSR
ncbi:MAG: DUF167 domain-containing protein [Rhodomicrobium sp.]|nr:DUF167 domain-containing protein [Rhodomicrobium sp.]